MKKAPRDCASGGAFLLRVIPGGVCGGKVSACRRSNTEMGIKAFADRFAFHIVSAKQAAQIPQGFFARFKLATAQFKLCNAADISIGA